MKRILSVFLCLVLIVSCFSTMVFAKLIFAQSEGFHNFVPVKPHNNNESRFTDVSSDDWFADEVQLAYKFGLIRGNSATTFNPQGNMRVSEAIALASRLHSIYHANGDGFVQGDPWYQVYVDYATANGLMSAGQFADYNAIVTRAEFAVLLSASLPSDALPAINDIQSIPDVYGYEAYAAAVYKLYNAGILFGNDSKGTFTPGGAIKRSEVAAIMARMAVPSIRKKFFVSVNNKPAPTMVNNSGSIGVDTFSVNLDAGQTVTIWVEAYGEDVDVIVDYDADCVNAEWGEWSGFYVPLAITALKDGPSRLRIYIDEDPASCVFVEVFGKAS